MHCVFERRSIGSNQWRSRTVKVRLPGDLNTYERGRERGGCCASDTDVWCIVCRKADYNTATDNTRFWRTSSCLLTSYNTSNIVSSLSLSTAAAVYTLNCRRPWLYFAPKNSLVQCPSPEVKKTTSEIQKVGNNLKQTCLFAIVISDKWPWYIDSRLRLVLIIINNLNNGVLHLCHICYFYVIGDFMPPQGSFYTCIHSHICYTKSCLYLCVYLYLYYMCILTAVQHLQQSYSRLVIIATKLHML